MAEASSQELNQFVQTVDKFMANYAKLISPETRTDVYASQNPALINEYENAVSQGDILKRTIDTTVGAWGAAKRAWASVTGVTSTFIGDAIDEIRSWFGYDPAPGMGALGAIQIPAAAWVAGIIAAAYLLNQTMHKIFISIEASRIIKRDPTISRERALTMAASSVRTSLFGGFGVGTMPLIAAGLIAAYFLLGKKSR